MLWLKHGLKKVMNGIHTPSSLIKEPISFFRHWTLFPVPKRMNYIFLDTFTECSHKIDLCCFAFVSGK